MLRLSDETKYRVLKLYSRGYSLSKLADIFALNKTTMLYHTNKAFGPHYSKTKFNPKLKFELGELWGIYRKR